MRNAMGCNPKTKPAARLQAIAAPHLYERYVPGAAAALIAGGAACAAQRTTVLCYAPDLASKSCKRCCRMLTVRSPRVRSSTPRNTSVLRRRPPVMASG